MSPEDQNSPAGPPETDERLTAADPGPLKQPSRFRQFQREFRSLDAIESASEERLEWELEKHLSLYKDYSDLALKAVGIFAATVGGILSISFGVGTDPKVKIFLLQAALVMSITMGVIFIACSALWFRVSTKAKWIATKLGMIKFPDIVYLSVLLFIFGVLFFVVAGGLGSLKSHFLSPAPPGSSSDPKPR